MKRANTLFAQEVRIFKSLRRVVGADGLEPPTYVV
jgi:hypothetical protein